MRIIGYYSHRWESDRLVGVFEALSSLLIVAQLLITLPLQVSLQDLLHQEQVGPFGPQEHVVGPWSLKHWKYPTGFTEYILLSCGPL